LYQHAWSIRIRGGRARPANATWAKSHFALRCGDRPAWASAHPQALQAIRSHAGDGGDNGYLLVLASAPERG
jgi:hypothetical protein